MKIAFTICSNNYLSQAKILGDSLVKNNPDYKFIIGLCDKKSELVDYSFYQYDIIEVDTIGIKNLDWMSVNYNIIELNTASKPYYFQFFIKNNDNLTHVMYFDPDIKIFGKLSEIEKELEDKSCILTPHILSPMPLDGKNPQETLFLNYGIYNLGFLGVRPCEETNKMLEWWAERLAYGCYSRVEQGIFVDQLPMNFVPLYFKNVHVSHHPGFNFAYWNMHERTESKMDEVYWVNKTHPLVFLHFSAFKPNYPLTISTFQNRFSLAENTTRYELFDEYAKDLINNKFFEYSKVPCHYVELRKNYLEKVAKEYKDTIKLSNRIKRKIKQLLYPKK